MDYPLATAATATARPTATARAEAAPARASAASAAHTARRRRRHFLSQRHGGRFVPSHLAASRSCTAREEVPQTSAAHSVHSILFQLGQSTLNPASQPASQLPASPNVRAPMDARKLPTNGGGGKANQPAALRPQLNLGKDERRGCQASSRPGRKSSRGG